MKTAMKTKLHDDPLCTVERVQTLLVSALEGGSNYWYYIVDYKLPKGKTMRHYRTKDFDEGLERYNIPLAMDGAAIIFTTIEELQTVRFPGRKKTGKYLLDRKAIQKGWALLREKHTRHYADVVQENDDACTGDVFLQLCLFGEVIFG